MKGIKALVMMLMVASLFGMVSASTTHTSSTDTDCNQVDGELICTKTIYSGIRNIYEDGQWKKIEDARSLMGSGIIPLVLEDDKEFPVEIVDYNYTSIHVKLNPEGIKIFNEAIPLRVWTKNATKEKEYKDVTGKDEKDVKALPEKEYKEIMDKVYDSEINFNIFNNEEEVVLEFGIGNVLEFGYNSTTITLQGTDTLNDAKVVETSPTTSFPTETLFQISNDSANTESYYIMFNLSSLPVGLTISSSTLGIWETGTNANQYLRTHYVYSNTTWSQGTLTWNNQPCGYGFNITSACNLTAEGILSSGSGGNEWRSFTATSMVKDSYDNSYDNVSILLRANYRDITNTFVGYTSENVADVTKRPVLNITYASLLSLNITSPINDTNYTTAPVTLNWTVGGDIEDFCWWSNDSMVTNTTVPCGDLQTAITPPQGTSQYYMWANDTSNNQVTDNVTFYIDSIAPVPTIDYPTATTYTTDVTQLNFTYVETDPHTCWYMNATDSTNYSVQACTSNFTGVVSAEGSNTWVLWMNDTLGNEGSDSVTFTKDSLPPQITIDYPDPATVANYTTDVTQLNFTYMETNPDDCWYTTDGGTTNLSVQSCDVNFTGITSVDGYNNWTAWMNDTTGNHNSSTVTFFRDIVSPTTTILNPNKTLDWYGQKASNGVTVYLNWTSTDDYLDSCWWSSNSTVNMSVTCGDNSTLDLDYGTYTFTTYANDTLGNLNWSTFSTTYAALINNSETYNATAYETENQSFILNFTYPSSDYTATAKLWYDSESTSYDGVISGAGDTRLATATIDIPGSLGVTANRTFYWNVSLTNVTGTYTYKMFDEEQDTRNVTLSICNEYFTVPYLNYTFKNQDTDTFVNASVPESTFSYWLGSGDAKKTYNYDVATYNYSYAFCFAPINRTVHNTIDFKFAASDYGFGTNTQASSSDLTNTTTNTLLYLLGTGGSTDSSLLVIGSGNNPIEDVSVLLERQISGSWVQVGLDTTDASGIVTFGINLAYDYRYTLTATGYETYTFVIRPTQSLYTVTLTATSTAAPDYSEGVNIKLIPQRSHINGNTEYNFTFYIDSSELTLSEYGLNITYPNGTEIYTDSDTTSTGGYLYSVINTTNLSSIVMNHYYITNSTQINGTFVWIVSVDGSYGITNLLNRVSTYIDANMYGILGDDNGNFAKAMLCILVLLLTTGTLSLRYGLTSDAAVTGVIFGAVFMLNLFDFIPTPEFITFISLGNVLVFIVGLVVVSQVIKEEGR